MRSIEQLTAELLALPTASRAILADTLVESLAVDINPAIQSAWVAEAQRRHNEILDSSVQPVDGDAALAQIRQRFAS
jgi:Putative addiction module component